MNITKKKFRELCDTSHVYGTGSKRINVIYIDWKDNEFGRGFKYGIASSIENCTKNELFNIAYDWIVNEKFPPYYVFTRFAQYDMKRFKVPISFNYATWN